MPSPGHILIVCTGNICRSPMGQGLLAHALSAQPEPLRSLKVISAGVAAHTGEAVSENSVTALKRAGIDIGHLRSQGLTQAMLDNALAVFGMTESHRSTSPAATRWSRPCRASWRFLKRSPPRRDTVSTDFGLRIAD